ncbi:MAG: tRNA pseudouridine(38-40) synthase TruA [Candidatus Helarchaeota archaeon]
MRYALKVFYFGYFEGFQRQPGKETIEGYLLKAFQNARLIEEPDLGNYMAAGRTDRGVHALGQVISISTDKPIIIPQLNSFLPKSIILWGIQGVHEKFHPRYEAFSRYYRYYTRYSGEDLELMRLGGKILEGVHDFQLFSKRAVDKNTVRHIFQILIERKGSFLIFHVIANSFLWQMVRRIVDALLKIGRKEWKLQDLESLLNKTPPSNIFTEPQPIENTGTLILWNIEYPFKFQYHNKSILRIRAALKKLIEKYSLKVFYSEESDQYFSHLI